MKGQPRKATSLGITILQVLVVIGVIALIIAIAGRGFSITQTPAARNRTLVALSAIQSALERYQKEFGEYPAPSHPQDSIVIDGKSYRVGAAAMLYQAVSGDGHDNILNAPGSRPAGQASSNGKLESEEVKNVMLTDMPREMYMERNGVYFLVDGYGKPFQYVKTEPPTGDGPPQTINSTFDLWSYGEDEENISTRSVDTLTPGPVKDASQKWIKNW